MKARRNNKELLREETDYLKQYLDISRVRTSQVAEGNKELYIKLYPYFEIQKLFCSKITKLHIPFQAVVPAA